jgi:hypothetical protein
MNYILLLGAIIIIFLLNTKSNSMPILEKKTHNRNVKKGGEQGKLIYYYLMVFGIIIFSGFCIRYFISDETMAKWQAIFEEPDL